VITITNGGQNARGWAFFPPPPVLLRSPSTAVEGRFSTDFFARRQRLPSPVEVSPNVVKRPDILNPVIRMNEDVSAPLRILVVDDCEDAAVTLSMLARLWGHLAWTAFDGAEALRLAAAHHPDVVFLDIGMPGMDGWQLTAQLRKTDGLSSAYLVAVTGYGQERDHSRSQEAGCDLHLLKPVPVDVLRQVLVSRQREKHNHASG